MTATTDLLRDALTANRVTVHGPVPIGDGTPLVLERVVAHGGTAAVAISPADRLVADLDLVEAFTDHGLSVLLPDDPQWRDRLPHAGVGVTGSLLAVAETGSLALAAGRGSPRAVSLLPPVHLCLVSTADVVPTFADAIARFADGPMPSALTWVGGPSRTGDLEMITTLGVHGPGAVEVILLDPAAAP